MQGAWVWSLVREQDPACHNQDWAQLNQSPSLTRRKENRWETTFRNLKAELGRLLHSSAPRGGTNSGKTTGAVTAWLVGIPRGEPPGQWLHILLSMGQGTKVRLAAFRWKQWEWQLGPETRWQMAGRTLAETRSIIAQGRRHQREHSVCSRLPLSLKPSKSATVPTQMFYRDSHLLRQGHETTQRSIWEELTFESCEPTSKAYLSVYVCL